MSGLGLIIGAGLAGGLEGGGVGTAASLKMTQEAQQKEDLVRLQGQIDLDKDRAIAALNNDYAMQRQTAQNTFQSSENKLDRAQQTSIEGMREASAANVANIEGKYHVQASLGAASIGAAATRYAANLAANKLEIQADAHGNYITFNPSTGETKPLLVGGQQLVGRVDLPQSTIAIATSMSNEALLKLKMDPDDAVAKAELATSRMLLGYNPPATQNWNTGDLTTLNQLLSQPNANQAQIEANWNRAHGPGTFAQAVPQAKALTQALGVAAKMPASMQKVVPANPAAATPAAPGAPTTAAPGIIDSAAPVAGTGSPPPAVDYTSPSAAAAPTGAAPAMQTTQGPTTTTAGLVASAAAAQPAQPAPPYSSPAGFNDQASQTVSPYYMPGGGASQPNAVEQAATAASNMLAQRNAAQTAQRRALGAAILQKVNSQ